MILLVDEAHVSLSFCQVPPGHVAVRFVLLRSITGVPPMIDWLQKLLVLTGVVVLSYSLPTLAEEVHKSAQREQFAGKSIPFYATDQKGSKPIGQLLVGTRAREITTRGAMSLVQIEGWYQKGAKRVLYAVPGKRIMELALKKKATGALRDWENFEDQETGLSWHRASIRGWVKSKLLSPDLDVIWHRADVIFSEKCTACHERRIPHHYSANQWIGNLKAMAPRAGLNKQERSLVLKFLQYRAKDMIANK